MEAIIKVRNKSYALYEEVLMQRDNLRKEAYIYQRNYVAEFGDRIIAVFEKKIECIRKKKIIEFAQAALNHGKSISQAELQAFLDAEMASFNEQLKAMNQDIRNARERQKITEYDLLKIKRIYHKLVKQIHPDINPETMAAPELFELWQRVQIAYNCNNLKDMEELEILVGKVLEELGGGTKEIDIPDIEEKIAAVEAEICQIRETDPYMYKYILEDPKAISDKNESLDKELKSYEDYSAQLEEVISTLMTSGVSIKWQMN